MVLLSLLLLQTPTRLTVDLTKPGVAVSPTLYGLMTEEINHSYDGGLYEELVRNRAFQDSKERPDYWTAVGEGSRVELDPTEFTNTVLSTSLGVHGKVANAGYWGFPIRPNTSYRLTVWVRTFAGGALTASLESTDGTKVYARGETMTLGGDWRQLTQTLRTGSDVAPTTDARLVLESKEETANLSYVSLMGPTYHNRPNGTRPDLMQLLVDMSPKFLRFPGGNYLEGGTIAERFQWKKTLGPVDHRPGHQAPWGYRSSDGLGLQEYLDWCEDMKAKPVLAIYAGYSLGGQVVKAGPELDTYVQDGLDEIEYLIGGPETKWGAERAANGHPKPYPLECVEIGNEDGFDRSGSYEGRFVQFYDAIKAKYPQLKVISTTGGTDWLGSKAPITKRKPDVVDEHYYASTWDMMGMATKYDSFPRNGPKIFVGEWASQDVPEPWTDAAHKGPTPNMKCAIADAAFLTGLERNSDLVTMSCYAPLLVNVNPGGRQWAVNLIGYDALNSFGSPSYYAQKMFAGNVGDHTVPATLSGVPTQSQGNKTLPGIFTSVTRDSRHGVVYMKLVNALPSAQEVQIDLGNAKVDSHGTVTVLSGELQAVNTLAEPMKVAPVTSQVKGLGRTFMRTLAPNSITVLRLSIRR